MSSIGFNSQKETFSQLEEMYVNVKKLTEEDSKLDSVSEPYASKYKATAILNEMKCKLVNMMDSIRPDEETVLARTKAMLAVVLLNLGIISVDTEEFSTGEEQLTKCLECLQDESLKPEHIMTVLCALNYLGLLWSHRDQPKRSRDFLERAESLYKDFTKNVECIPVDAQALFCNLDYEANKSADGLEKIYTLTLYYLAQIYGKLDDHLRSAVYCHSTLKRQLESKDYDPIDWALNAATLSQYFTEKNRFREARHHLCAASYILDQYEADLQISERKEGSEEYKAKKERFHHRRADVARCWSMYGLNLLLSSKDRLMSRAEEDDNLQQGDAESESHMSESSNELSQLWFNSLELSCYEDQVTDQFVLTFQDARKIFVNAQDWVNKAKEYYTLEDLASDYVKIIQDYSQLYKYVSFFEEDEAIQCRMHKRRIDLLESVLKELNPQYYLNVCQQLWYEAAETFSDILDIKIHHLQSSNERPTPHALQKINSLAENGIKHFTNFLDSFKDSNTRAMPKKLAVDMVRPAMLAFFLIGRLHNKIISSDKRIQLENTQKTLSAYKTLVDYCAEDKEAAKLMSLELSVCQEMVLLLPHKIEKLKREIQA